MRRLLPLFLVVLAAAPALAAVSYQTLGTVAPPATVGGYTMQVFNSAAQAAITDSTNVTTIPGSPVPGSLTIAPAASKRTVPATWGTWSHSYTGPVFYFVNLTSGTLHLPPGAGAFYFYAEPDSFSAQTFTATTNTGATSGPVSINGSSGATGIAFYTTTPGEMITTITVTTTDTGGFAIGEFAIALNPGAIPALDGKTLAMLIAALAMIGYLALRH